MVEFIPPPKDTRNYGYDYLRQVPTLKENSFGTVTISAKGTTVTGATTCRFTDSTTGDFLRVNRFGTDEDSKWYRIISIANDSSLTISTAFENSAVANADYVISSAPEMPVRLHPAVLYGALRTMVLDQTDESFIAYSAKMAEVLTDAKRIHVTRKYSEKLPHIGEDFLYRR
jgi:hypothetical protein